jgi:hypothetical protein
MRARSVISIALNLIVASAASVAQTSPPDSLKRIVATRAPALDVRIDGRLDEVSWSTAAFVSDFTQKDPVEGAAPSERTELAVLYDDEAIYIGARLHRADPTRIHRNVTRRDDVGNTERLIVSLDTYHDRRTAYSFVVTAAGAIADYYHPSDQEFSRDYSYDPVWEADASVDGGGWSAEIRIPFSQLRFNDADEQVWGINIDRWIPDLNEDIYWRLISKDDNGWSSRFGELVGLRRIRPSTRIELMPYVAAQADAYDESDPDDPFARTFSGRAGVDLKMGIGPNLTLDATVNPDFGQVEADPAEVNLSAFESFFSERRPFFVEGADLLRGSGASYFYSRRIGGSPSGYASGAYVDAPNNSTILAATKLTGRLASGLSVAALGAVTEREFARVTAARDSAVIEVEVEPLTFFGISRLQQEFGESQSTVGVMGTIVHRDLSRSAALADAVVGDAITGGIDYLLRFEQGEWDLSGHVGGSHVRGSTRAMESLQRSSSRYYQRPDAGHVEIDTTRTSLSGYTIGGTLAKNSGTWQGYIGIGAESPGLELNDAGQLGTADDIDAWSGLSYHENEPGAVLRNYRLSLDASTGWNYDGINTYRSFGVNANATLTSFWSVSGWGGFNLPGQSDNLSRGGPSMGTALGGYAGINVNTPSTESVRAWMSLNASRNAIGGWDFGTDLELSGEIGDRLSFSVGPHFSRSMTPRQYVTAIDGPNELTYRRRYVFARIDQTYLSGQLRLGYVITPRLSIDVYAEPFVGSGRFFDYGELPEPGTTDIRRYESSGATVERVDESTVRVVDNGEEFLLPDQSFTFLSFRSNVVLRWEWLRGSTAYLVWQRSAGAYSPVPEPVRVHHIGDAITSSGGHVVAVKIAYWFPVD